MSKDDKITAEFEDRAKRILKAELRRRDIKYRELAEMLTERGVTESERNLQNKISRGRFSTSFFLLCMDTIGASQLQLDA